jgi:hypothetical protein
MTLQFCTDVAPADWIVDAAVPWDQLVTFGPDGFDAYTRLRFIPDPTRPRQEEADAEVPEDHPTDIAQTAAALQVLSAFTRAPDEWYFCVWDGSGRGELPPEVLRGPMVVVPHRRFALLRGTSTDFDDWETFFDGNAPTPAFVWPADHAWCFACDVDPHWAGIGGTHEAIDALLRSDLDVVPAHPAETQPTYG